MPPNQTPNPRGHHGGEVQDDPLEDIIRSFNERWFQGWNTTSGEQLIDTSQAIGFTVKVADSIKG